MDCPICNYKTHFLTEKKDRFGATYHYVICDNCRFLFEQDLAQNPVLLKEKVQNLYGKNYFNDVDAGWQGRGESFLKVIKKIITLYKFFSRKKMASVLDYGAGNGYLASRLADSAEVFYYDIYEKPTFLGNYNILEKPQKADMMLAVELVEHVTSIESWDFLKEVTPDVFMFTTCLTDNIKEKQLPHWNYLKPDAGHMALYSTKSLYLLGKKYGFVYVFFPNIATHIFVKNTLLSYVNFVAIEYFLYSVMRKMKNVNKK